MVATENSALSNKITAVLRNKGYRVTIKRISEKNLLGEERGFHLIHAVSSDNKTIITVRISSQKDKHRLHITAHRKSKNTINEIASRLENMGFRVLGENEGVTAAGLFDSENIYGKITKAVDIVK